MVNIEINENKFWKKFNHKESILWLKGKVYSHSPIELLNAFNKVKKSEINSFIQTLRGHFAIIFKNKVISILIVDRVRSSPLHYTKIKKNFFLSPSSNDLVKNRNFKMKVNQSAFQEIAMAGFVIGSKSIYNDLNSLVAGQYAIFENGKVKVENYFSYFDKISNQSYNELLNELTEITISIFKKLIIEVGDRQIVIPLSAGNDSRLVASILKHLGAKNVKCYSYGQKNNFEAKTAEKIANELNFEWILVPLTHKTERNYYKSKKYQDFLNYAETHCSIPFIQSISTFEYLKKIDFINNDAIFINGNSGDFISGGHINQLYRKLDESFDKKAIKDLILNQLVNKHFSLWGFLKSKENLKKIKETLWETIRKECSELNLNNAHLFYEYSEFIDRQSKYVISGQRVYEYYGYDWKLPLWDDEYLFFWKKVPSSLKFKQKLYLDMLKKNNFGGVWNDKILINRKKISPIWIVPLRFLAKIPFAFFGSFGKKAWKQFHVNVFNYWIDPTLMICNTSYSIILKDIFKKPRNSVSWISKKYLKSYGNNNNFVI